MSASSWNVTTNTPCPYAIFLGVPTVGNVASVQFLPSKLNAAFVPLAAIATNLPFPQIMSVHVSDDKPAPALHVTPSALQDVSLVPDFIATNKPLP